MIILNDLVGSLVRFSSEKRALYFPNSSAYPNFDGQVGLVTSHRVNNRGEDHVAVKWLKPFVWQRGSVTTSHFNLLNFEVVSK